jgi:hypothetical protein
MVADSILLKKIVATQRQVPWLRSQGPNSRGALQGDSTLREFGPDDS